MAGRAGSIPSGVPIFWAPQGIAAVNAPFAQYSWPLPQQTAWQAAHWSNRGFAVQPVQIIVRPAIYSLPQSARYPYERLSWFESPQSSDNPFAQTSWPLPMQTAWQTIRWSNRAVTVDTTPPQTVMRPPVYALPRGARYPYEQLR
jgi:hypothetical protein